MLSAQVQYLEQAIDSYILGEHTRATLLSQHLLAKRPDDRLAVDLATLMRMQEPTLQLDASANAAMWLEMADKLVQQHYYTAAHRVLRWLDSRIEKTGHYYCLLAQCEFAAGLIDTAIQHLHQALQSADEVFSPYRHLIEMLRAAGRNQEANNMLHHVAELVKDKHATADNVLFVCQQMAQAFWASRQFSACQDVVTKALRLDRHDPIANVMQAQLALREKSWVKAKEYYWRAYLGDHYHVEAMAGLVMIDESPPLEMVKKFLNRQQSTPIHRAHIYHILGQISEREHAFHEAWGYFKKSRALKKKSYGKKSMFSA